MKGDVVVVPFPFSNLQQVKNRPALILIDLHGSDVVMAAITSTDKDPNGVELDMGDFSYGNLSHTSYIHPAKLFTFERSLIKRTVGHLKIQKHKEVIDRVISLIS